MAQSITDSSKQCWHFGQPEKRFELVSKIVQRAIQHLQVDKSKDRDLVETLLAMRKKKDYCQAGCFHCQRYEEYPLEDLNEYLQNTLVLNAKSDAFLRWLLPILGVCHVHIMWISLYFFCISWT